MGEHFDAEYVRQLENGESSGIRRKAALQDDDFRVLYEVFVLAFKISVL